MIVSFSVTLPSFVCGLGIWCQRHKRRSRASTSGRAVASPTFSVSPPAFLGFSAPPPPDRGDNSSTSLRGVTSRPTVVPGHQREMITQSFPEFEVGDSRHITGPSVNICAICLSECHPKDILKILPECDHFFHAKCIDEWLRIKIECPVCRNSTFSA